MAARRSKTQWGPMRWCLLMLLALAAVLSGGCATIRAAPPPAVTIQVAEALREPCQEREPPADDYAASWIGYGYVQAGDIRLCERKRIELVGLIEQHAAIVTPPPPPKPKRRWLPER